MGYSCASAVNCIPHAQKQLFTSVYSFLISEEYFAPVQHLHLARKTWQATSKKSPLLLNRTPFLRRLSSCTLVIFLLQVKIFYQCPPRMVIPFPFSSRHGFSCTLLCHVPYLDASVLLVGIGSSPCLGKRKRIAAASVCLCG